MQLTMHTDYSLRVLMYLAQKSEMATITEIAEFHGVSRNHLVKVVHELGKLGFLKTLKGRGGGILLARPASEIRVAEVVRKVEPHFILVECFDRKKDTCRISAGCRLKGVLAEAQGAFLDSLARYSIADLLARK